MQRVTISFTQWWQVPWGGDAHILWIQAFQTLAFFGGLWRPQLSFEYMHTYLDPVQSEKDIMTEGRRIENQPCIHQCNHNQPKTPGLNWGWHLWQGFSGLSIQHNQGIVDQRHSRKRWAPFLCHMTSLLCHRTSEKEQLLYNNDWSDHHLPWQGYIPCQCGVRNQSKRDQWLV
jgi:hypothetical protein